MRSASFIPLTLSLCSVECKAIYVCVSWAFLNNEIATFWFYDQHNYLSSWTHVSSDASIKTNTVLLFCLLTLEFMIASVLAVHSDLEREWFKKLQKAVEIPHHSHDRRLWKFIWQLYLLRVYYHNWKHESQCLDIHLFFMECPCVGLSPGLMLFMEEQLQSSAFCSDKRMSWGLNFI